MSAFLGPIHVKMYDRILFQDALSQALLALSEEKGWADGLRAQVDTEAPAASQEPLATLIDQNNIHGWLNEAVTNSERRFARVARGVLTDHPERLDALQDAMKQAGRQSRLPATIDAEQAFQLIHDVLLDGMPCDFPFVVTESSAGAVVWQVGSCPHAPHWEVEPQTYYQLRDAWVEGALEGTGIVHTRSSDGHALRKER